MSDLPEKLFRYVEFGKQERFLTIEQLAESWLIDNENDWQSGPLKPATNVALNLSEYPDLLWQFVLAVVPRATKKHQLAYLAAGPFEDLIHGNGDDFIDRIELAARQSPKFRYMLTGVWGDDNLSDDFVARFKAAVTGARETGIESDADMPPF